MATCNWCGENPYCRAECSLIGYKRHRLILCADTSDLCGASLSRRVKCSWVMNVITELHEAVGIDQARKVLPLMHNPPSAVSSHPTFHLCIRSTGAYHRDAFPLALHFHASEVAVSRWHTHGFSVKYLPFVCQRPLSSAVPRA